MQHDCKNTISLKFNKVHSQRENNGLVYDYVNASIT